MNEPYTLADIEAALQRRLTYLDGKEAEGFESPPWDAWMECYQALIQVKQAHALEGIAKLLDGFRVTGFPVENVS